MTTALDAAALCPPPRSTPVEPPEPPASGESLRAARGAELAALGAVVARFEAPLLRHAAHILRDADRARDVVQDTFLRLWESEIDPDDPRLKSWLFTVCRNRAIDVLRRDARLTLVAELPETPATVVEASEEIDRAVSEVFEQIADMSPKRARVLEMRFRDGHSYRRIAELTGMSVSHVGVVIHKSVAALKKHVAAVALLSLVLFSSWLTGGPSELGTFSRGGSRSEDTAFGLSARDAGELRAAEPRDDGPRADGPGGRASGADSPEGAAQLAAPTAAPAPAPERRASAPVMQAPAPPARAISSEAAPPAPHAEPLPDASVAPSAVAGAPNPPATAPRAKQAKPLTDGPRAADEQAPRRAAPPASQAF